ncbi:uncharacterized protein LOC129971770 [Argiope bruennichi]|uniref:uncharacterized protein LOC129971770 n=1 Tax=Argiope bruennichi TaxID=94029 RepID=UPI002494700F|nr:uncharacterized protein LOC129971770 [Argiope bruennichi]
MYPTVVDIQVSIKPEIDMPGISVCNGNGYKPGRICEIGPYCTLRSMLMFIPVCDLSPIFCVDGLPMPDFTLAAYNRFFSDYNLNTSLFEEIKVPLDEFFTCTIVSGSGERKCDTEHALVGSYYSSANAPSICYTINSLWSQPNLKIQKIKKSEKIVLQFYIDISFRNRHASLDEIQHPTFSSFSSSTVQMAIHSPYVYGSPYIAGVGFLGGKNYRVKIKESEKHLLPPPYQTNCTDYMPEWRARGGVGPLNQIMVIQECKLNETLRQLGCVPITVDYPHDEKVCKFCETCTNITKIGRNCTNLLQYYNQPCHSIVYDVKVEEKLVHVKKQLTSATKGWNETMYFSRRGFDCTLYNKLKRRCQTINVEIVFDDFEITNITYNPKFESLELFSAIGGYMGIYLGASIVTFYDFAEIAFTAILKYTKKQRKIKKRNKSRHQSSWMFETFPEDSSLRAYRKRKINPSDGIRNIY